MTIDAHADLGGYLNQPANRQRSNVLQQDLLPDFLSGEIRALVAAVYLDQDHLPHPLHHAMNQIGLLLKEIREGEDFCLATGAKSIRSAWEKRKIALLLSLEGAEPIQDLAQLDAFYAMGLRFLGLSWSRRNRYADGCDFLNFEIKKGGLSLEGIALIERARDLGIVIDLSHLSDEGIQDVLQHCSRGVISSHTNARALSYIPRNHSDEILKGIADRGGVIGLNVASRLVSADAQVGWDHLMNQLLHLIRVAGEDHVGFGFDFCDKMFRHDASVQAFSHDILGTHQNVPRFLEKMANHLPERVIDKIRRENWMRFYEEELPE